MRSLAMKICLTCKRRYADSLQFCLEDGTVLEAARESEPTLVDPQATLRLTPRETNPPAAPAKRGNILIFLGVGGLLLFAVIGIVVVIVVFQFSSNTRGASTSNTNQASVPSPALEMRSPSEIVTDTNNQIGVALLNGNIGALSRLLADDYRYVSDAGLTLNKPELLLLMRTGDLSWESLKSMNENVEMTSDTKAELTAIEQSKGQLRHKAFNETNFYKNVFEKRGNRWLLVSETVWHRQ